MENNTKTAFFQDSQNPQNPAKSGLSKRHKQYFTPEFYAPGIKVLAADDSRAALFTIEALLHSFRMNVDVCLDGRQAVERVIQSVIPGNRRYDIVILDHVMPNLYGAAAAAEIKALSPETVVIAVTSECDASCKEEFIRAGASDFIEKPISSCRVGQILSRYIPESEKIYTNGNAPADTVTKTLQN
ncbi:hypothetical protein FACS189499_00050 [Clostridia bacterium]|nr:hypothetical protein FACS189499_00050 [Clostridia bacterium]